MISPAVTDDSAMPELDCNTEILWVRVWYDGDNVSVKCLKDNSDAPTEGEWDAADVCFTSDAFPMDGGFIGFGSGGEVHIDDLTVESPDGEGWKTEIVEDFNHNGWYEEEQPTHDAAGNLTYDGRYGYVYDAWNRLAAVKRAYRDASNVLHKTSTVATINYDGLGRRTAKKIENSGDWNETYHFYYDGRRLVEERNGSQNVLKQYLWGTQYVDELVQVAVNDDPDDGGEQNCETAYWPLLDANYNVTALVDADGSLKERYEYTPYGERTVYKSAGANDALCMSPVTESQRAVDGGAHSLCDFGMQGKLFNKEFGLYDWDRRLYNPVLARAMQPDPLGYPDGMNRYEWERSNPVTHRDPTGTVDVDYDPRTDEWHGAGPTMEEALAQQAEAEKRRIYAWQQGLHRHDRYAWSDATDVHLVHAQPLCADADEFYVRVFEGTLAARAGKYVGRRGYSPYWDAGQTAFRACGLDFLASAGTQHLMSRGRGWYAWRHRAMYEEIRETFELGGFQARGPMVAYGFKSRASIRTAQLHRKARSVCRRIGLYAAAAEAIAFAGNRATGIYVYRTASDLSPTATHSTVWKVADYRNWRQRYVTRVGGYLTDDPLEKRTFEHMSRVDKFYRNWHPYTPGRPKAPAPRGLLRYTWDAFAEAYTQLVVGTQGILYVIESE